MDTVIDFFKSIYDSYKERVKSPFVGSFVLSFIIFNWRSFAILFYSEWPIHCRIEWVEGKYCKLDNFLWPLGISLFYILILPYFNLAFDWLLSPYSSRKRRKLDSVRYHNLEIRRREAGILREIADAQAGTSEINSLKERIESLQNESKNLTKQNQDDLNRHNTVLEQARFREKELIDQIKILNIQISLFKGDSEFPDNFEINPKIIKEAIQIGDSFNDQEKTEFIEFVKDYRSGKELGTEEMVKYEKLKLISTKHMNLKGRQDSILTSLGFSVFEYLNNGYDLM